MRIVLFDDYKPGVLKGDQIIDLSPFLPWEGAGNLRKSVRELIAFCQGSSARLNEIVRASEGIPAAGVRLRAPSPEPDQLLCAAKNYKDGHETPKADFFLKPLGTIVGPDDIVELPAIEARVFHAEPELAVVIGKRAENVKAANAMDYVFGYTCFLDVSARGVSPTFYIHKSFSTFAPMGPAIVTADEISDPHNLRVRIWVGGDLRQDFSTGEMANRIDRLIEVASSVCPLQPGDVIPTGTHHLGLGCVQDGDAVTIEIEKVGRMSVTIHDARKRTWERPPAFKGAAA